MSDEDSNQRRHRVSLLNDEGDLKFGLASPPSNYKTRGEIDDPGATGVFGHNTAGSGKNRGVYGRVQSPSSDASGVLGESVAPEAGVGVRGITQGKALGSAGTVGKAAATGTSGPTYGVAGNTEGSGLALGGDRFPSAGVAGGSSTTGVTTGVLGQLNSSVAGNAAVEGRANADGVVYGVSGKTSGTGDFVLGNRSVSAGVIGESNGSGYTVGVSGINYAPGTDNAGVEGESVTSGTTHGVYGKTSSEDSNAAGVYGEAAPGPLPIGSAVGVRGVTNSSDSGAVGIQGEAPHPAAALNAEGWADVGNVGASAYLSSSQTVSSGAPAPKVQFDETRTNHEGQFDTSSYEYTIPRDGHYMVDAKIEYKELLSQGTVYDIRVSAGGNLVARKRNRIPKQGGDSRGSVQVSKLLAGLSAGDTIEIRAFHDEGSDLTILTDRSIGYALSYFTVAKIG